VALQIYNTLSRTKETFVPGEQGKVRIYVCGVTVYDVCHVGHARALVMFDVVYRYLKFLGNDVVFVRNFTDVDDKIIQRANAEGVASSALAERYIAEFQRDSRSLDLWSPEREPKATEHIAEMVALISRLEEKGLAYQVDGDVFFEIERFPGYGKLSGKKIEELEVGARVDVDARKKHPVDFALWKRSKEGEPAWDSPWGKGRPGWHIECSAMSSKYLGQPFDIHGGGMDLIFPHHENEIAQSEGAFDRPLARYWMHNGHVTVHGEKMSKSLGNFFTIKEVVEKYDPLALRQYLISSHYRSQLNFSLQGLEEAGRGIERIYETLERLGPFAVAGDGRLDEALLGEFCAAMDDDFNTPRAMAVIFEEVRNLNRLADEGNTGGLSVRLVTLQKMAEVLGLLDKEPQAFARRKKDRWLKEHGLTAEGIEELVRKRDRARSEKRWDEADRIRGELKQQGILVEDSPQGTIWKVQ
jgi:cysteinyl-tRNA synthetase